MELDINSIIAAVGGAIGTGSLAAIIGATVPLVVKKKTLGKLARKLVGFAMRGVTAQSTKGEGWKATVVYLIQECADEVDDYFESKKSAAGSK
jgi:hypothetical protein